MSKINNDRMLLVDYCEEATNEESLKPTLKGQYDNDKIKLKKLA